MFISQFRSIDRVGNEHWHKFIIINNGVRSGLSIISGTTDKIHTLANWGEYLNFRLELIK